ncbi:ABC transporter ATP-binding protein [Roseospira marina]|uniref:ABC transporter ATP-binding protein n=1 Tax=Roseospira marina TaxID=140057 RepID=A0A5M6IDX6_9PROT|nr:ABC transporter ATP-binding protein [Roseospira marina]KAA5605788.1 ABC transporter ATP-binding protein [Roseospira marina]MBB4313599.1 spermidine/putrescine transport system ATP-binding protein [Roseospira marina]MBB5086761.1 spermidine/putrescine transport system ATP-binding protein [Roseospira marina]
MNQNVILQIAGLYKRFGDFTALHSIDLKVHDGEFLAIVGPSGSGKTTLIRLFVGMDEPTDGTIWLRGQRIDTVPANQRPTCMVFQSLALFPHMTVGQNIEFPLKIRGMKPAERTARALELLDLLRLPRSYHGKRIHQCSGGERQRVALARALAFDPEILFFDEPLSALDYRLRKTLEKELKDLHARTGKTFVYITHSLEEAMAMSDRIAIMRAGKFEQIAPADDIYNRPVSRFVAEFMGEVNLFPLTVEESGAASAGSFTLPPRATARFGLVAGDPATLMVRPEYIGFVGAGTETEPDLSVRGRVLNEFNLGSRFQYEIEAEDGQRLTVETQRDERFGGAIGDTVTLGWAIDHCHVIRGE